ncbi:MAG: DegT/DnrJ/EryC1/StrS family aminotransferase [Chloroflexi bacterium]|nr:DegT/DnrJ/EryC1/StrS family aminotransferase [Chloroflexota bacterium]
MSPGRPQSVPVLDLKAQYATIRAQVREAVDRVLEGQHFILGPEVAAFEAEVARYCGAKHAVGCASGSDALLLSLMALGIGQGDEVITTPFTFFATAGCIARLGAKPVFVDIEPEGFNIDSSLVEERVGQRTRAIIVVHLYGQCCTMGPVLEVAGRHGIPVVEDAAQALGATHYGRRAGTMAEVGCFSFYPTKNLGGAGDGGLVVTGDDGLAEKLRVLRVHGARPKYVHRYVGLNSRLDELQAAILRVKLPYLAAWSDMRAQRADTYDKLFMEAGLAETVGLPTEMEGNRHIYHQYVVRVPRRDELREHLAARGVGTEVYYPLSLHLQECFRDLGHRPGDFPQSEKAAAEVLALPMYPELTLAQQEAVVGAVREFYAR